MVGRAISERKERLATPGRVTWDACAGTYAAPSRPFGRDQQQKLAGQTGHARKSPQASARAFPSHQPIVPATGGPSTWSVVTRDVVEETISRISLYSENQAPCVRGRRQSGTWVRTTLHVPGALPGMAMDYSVQWRSICRTAAIDLAHAGRSFRDTGISFRSAEPSYSTDPHQNTP